MVSPGTPGNDKVGVAGAYGNLVRDAANLGLCFGLAFVCIAVTRQVQQLKRILGLDRGGVPRAA